MIKKVEVLVSFPQGASFNECMTLDLYMNFLNFIKDLSCVCIGIKCMNCTEKKMCRYNKITGDNFTEYPGIFMDIEYFEKRKYRFNEQKKFVFFLIGNQQKYLQYISLYFENLHQRLFGNLFYLKKIDIEDMISIKKTYNHLRLITPISQLSFINEYNQMVKYYNEIYDTDFQFLAADEKVEKNKKIILNKFKVKTRKITHKGFVGYYMFSNKIEIDDKLILIGIGKFNYIGGGKIET